jgi:hypothetical protein
MDPVTVARRSSGWGLLAWLAVVFIGTALAVALAVALLLGVLLWLGSLS